MLTMLQMITTTKWLT